MFNVGALSKAADYFNKEDSIPPSATTKENKHSHFTERHLNGLPVLISRNILSSSQRNLS